MMVMMPAVMTEVAAFTRTRRPQIDVDDSRDGAEAGLALQAEGLKRNRVGRAADQEVGSDPDANGGVGADTAVAAGESAVAEPHRRRVDGPGQAGLRGDADVKTDALDVSDIGLRRRANVAAEDAFQLGRRADDLTDRLGAMAFQNTGLNILLGIGGRE